SAPARIHRQLVIDPLDEDLCAGSAGKGQRGCGCHGSCDSHAESPLVLTPRSWKTPRAEAAATIAGGKPPGQYTGSGALAGREEGGDSSGAAGAVRGLLVALEDRQQA